MKNQLKSARQANISARCLPQVKEKLYYMSRAENRSKSDIISESIMAYYQTNFSQDQLIEKEKKIFGRYSSAKGGVALNRKKYLKEFLLEKHRGD
jgi:hypothetical protein